MGRVLDMRSFPTGGVLILTEKGWFLTHMVKGLVAVDAASSADTGHVVAMRGFPGARP
jgi:hypothetical protein